MGSGAPACRLVHRTNDALVIAGYQSQELIRSVASPSDVDMRQQAWRGHELHLQPRPQVDSRELPYRKEASCFLIILIIEIENRMALSAPPTASTPPPLCPV